MRILLLTLACAGVIGAMDMDGRYGQTGQTGQVDLSRFLRAVAQRENGGWTWTRGGEYGPHQVTIGIARDYCRLVHRLDFVDESEARVIIVNEYNDLIRWHAGRLRDRAEHFAGDSVREQVRWMARAWKYGISGALQGRGDGDQYIDAVANLYEAEQR